MVDAADIKVGYSCNNDCIHCVIAGKRRDIIRSSKKPDRTTEEVFEEIRQAKKNGVSRVVLTGGEITIRSDVFDIVRFAKDMKLSKSLNVFVGFPS